MGWGPVVLRCGRTRVAGFDHVAAGGSSVVGMWSRIERELRAVLPVSADDVERVVNGPTAVGPRSGPAADMGWPPEGVDSGW